MQFGLTLHDVSKSFGATRVLNGVSMDVRPGEFVSLVGPSGCGKSTLLRIVAGLEKADMGTIAIGNKVVDDLGPRQRNIAMVFQNYALYPHMSAFDNIALPLAVSRLNLLERLPLFKFLSPKRVRIMREIATEVDAVAGQLRIEPLLHRKPGQLSGGQRQRVALARAMVRKPTLFLMDEPLSNLDAQLRVHMRDELSELHARLGATFVYVTHDQIEAMTMSSRVAMLDAGRLAQFGSPAELYARPASLAVAKFIGSPAINVLSAVVSAGGDVLLGNKPSGLHLPHSSGALISFCLRPEHLRIADKVSTHKFTGRIRRNEHHGSERLLHIDLIDLLGQSLVMRLGHEEAANLDLGGASTISVTFDPKHAHLFGEDGMRLEPVESARALRMAAQ